MVKKVITKNKNNDDIPFIQSTVQFGFKVIQILLILVFQRYTKKLNFELIEDTYQPEQDKRWVVVSPPGSKGATFLLAKASKPEQEQFIGNQSGGQVFLFLNTDDFWRDYNEMISKRILLFYFEPS